MRLRLRRDRQLPLAIVAGGVLLLGILYTILYTLTLPGPWASLLELAPGALAVLILLLGGDFRPRDLYLRFAPLSWKGIGVLAAMSLILLAPVLPAVQSGWWEGFIPLRILVYAPASAVAQELYFRASLLPLLRRLLSGRRWAPLALHALLFGVWHVPRAYLSAPVDPLPGTLGVAFVTLIAGLGWGWQVQHDRTLVWAVTQHTLFLMIMSLFGL